MSEEKLGRPTKYKEEYDDKIIAMAREGLHHEEMASALDVNIDTLYEWRRTHPSFSEAFTRARVHNKAWWLSFGRHNLKDPNLNEKTYELILRCKLGMGDKDRTHANPDLKKAKNYDEQKNAILQSFAQGNLTAKEWLDVVNGLAALAKIEETHELKIMIEEIKEKIG